MSVCNGMELLKLTTCKKRVEIECLFFIECLHKVALGAFKLTTLTYFLSFVKYKNLSWYN